MKKMSNYDEDVIDDADLEASSVDVSPNYYIFQALKKIQDCLIAEKLSEGMTKYCFLVDQIESLCSAASILDEEYKEYKKKLDSEQEEKTLNYEDKIKNTFKKQKSKLDELLKRIFDTNTLKGKINV